MRILHLGASDRKLFVLKEHLARTLAEVTLELLQFINRFDLWVDLAHNHLWDI